MDFQYNTRLYYIDICVSALWLIILIISQCLHSFIDNYGMVWVALLVTDGSEYYQHNDDDLIIFLFLSLDPRKVKRNSGARQMLAFGGHLTVSNVANYLSGNLDNLLIGKFIGADGLGI